MNTADTGRVARSLSQQLGAQLIETHISCILLTDDIAFKLKKPLRLPFVDYSTLQSRKFFCEEELRLNSRLAPSLYLEVVPITGSPDQPRVGGSGAVLDYAIRMRRFPEGALFSQLLQTGSLQPADVDELAALLARFHTTTPVAQARNGFGAAQVRRALAFAALDGAAPAMSLGELPALRDWMQSEAQVLSALWRQRQASGRVRECHGDLHLANVVRLDGGVAAFDGIEFDPALRWIDVIDDISFPIMDFCHLGSRAFAFRLLNAWLDLTGDHAGLPALRFSIVYRALVRAQVAHLRGPGCAPDARRYIESAQSWTLAGRPGLCVTNGLPGSGKTFESQRLLESEGAIRLRSDVERKRLFGLSMLDNSRAAGLNLYDREATVRTYDRLFELARMAIGSGYPAVIDAAFLRRDERDRARALAAELAVPFAILACEAPPQALRARLRTRVGDASEADEAVLERLRATAQPLEADERALCLPASAGHQNG